jgi:hypothetical protein
MTAVTIAREASAPDRPRTATPIAEFVGNAAGKR